MTAPTANSHAIAAQVPRYLDAAGEGDRRTATDIALGLLESGYPADQIVTELLGAAQILIGDRWHRGEWTVAMEHRATAITEAALHTVSDTALSLPGAPAPGGSGRVVIACSEGEWHVVPGLMATEVLRLRGADVSFIGPSLPAVEMATMLGVDPPSAVAVTCSMPLSLMGSWRTISALRAVGMTVVCGGRGFGPQGRWGLAIGADHWAPDFSTGADLLLAAIAEERPAPRPPGGQPEARDEVTRLLLEADIVVDTANRAALANWPELAAVEAARRATREDLEHTLKILGSATIASDPQVLTDYVEWFESLLVSRGFPVGYVATALDLLLDALPSDLAIVRSMAEAGLVACTHQPLTPGPLPPASPRPPHTP